MEKSLAFFTLVTLTVIFAATASSLNIDHAEDSLVRLVRAAGTKKQDCRYEKEAWEECDATTGLQRRALKLKANGRSEGAQCEETKYISRPCKKVACKYLKGTWTECVDGERKRMDQLRNVGSGCDEVRPVVRKCKPVCRYLKSEWSACESGSKTKTLTLSEGDAANCEAKKTISKQCSTEPKPKQKSSNKQRGRKQKPQSDRESAVTCTPIPTEPNCHTCPHW